MNVHCKWRSHLDPVQFYRTLFGEMIGASDQVAVEGLAEHPDFGEARLLRLALGLRRVADRIREAGEKHPLLPAYDFSHAVGFLSDERNALALEWPHMVNRLEAILVMLRDIPRSDDNVRPPFGVPLAELLPPAPATGATPIRVRSL